ncbi:MAG: coniferyl-aldehyde dehydrogenase [Rheinheimera sp.]|uniref:coniferyl aldehyde dehydrogenase n=1 Tax=Arsukibacterium sp. UBA3155 TaxID=1946058 RepID=UPI000C8DB032|nr:coniferyl aldehyde dehydrogenase [Arsukibacterium sp. UBA3155]MAD74752.1 coniferyl-aldehyde dehydrogenase [Rheinheimera sp.]|tara:strand:+ start:35382 stop:36800 length:1419 start_codon:yes stop_codon:yes gene_type:complete
MSALELQFQKQKHAFNLCPYPDYSQRQQQLKALRQAIEQHSAALCTATSSDFGYRSSDETRLLEIMPALSGIDYHLKRLKGWLKPEKRHVHYSFMPASNRVMLQPVGVVGIIVPWNYPVYLALGPLMAAIAAGNKTMLKLSEYTPATNKVLRQICQQALGNDAVVIEGDAEIAATFSRLPFDHLLFTGSTAVGRKVMQAAAANLTPVTLELGGKSPVLIAPDADIKHIAKRILFGKTANAGQTCVAPDYVLVPKAKLELLITELCQAFKDFYPDFATTPDYSSVINTAQYQRLTAMLEHAIQSDARVIDCSGQSHDHSKDSEVSNSKRRLALQLIIGADDNSNLMEQEIFGPLLPLIPYDTFDNALQYIQQRPRPLALYLMSDDKATVQQVLRQTHVGGVCINDTLVHVAQDDLPFGGIGPSGLGNYHGKEGFMRFSHQKAIHKKGRFNSGRFIYPPFNRKVFKAILSWLTR